MKNIKTKILVSLVAFTAMTAVASAAAPGVAATITPASLEKNAGDIFGASVVVNTPGSKVYAVEGTLAFDGLSCQSIAVADGLVAQSAPTCTNPYFLVGIPSGTATDKEILHVVVKAAHPGNAALGLSSVDVIGEGMSLSSVANNGVYTITEVALSPSTPNHSQVSTFKKKIAKDEALVATSTPSTQLALVEEFVAANSVLLALFVVLFIAFGYRYIGNRRAQAVASQDASPTQKGK